MKHTVVVTRGLIRRGIRCDCLRCPITLALLAATGDYWSASEYYLCREADGLKLTTPRAAADWLTRYDTLGPAAVSPFAFNLEIPS